jgi:multiple sugar transport system substrate-binding protein
MVPQHSQNPEAAKAFMLHLVANYDQATFSSELYNFPAWDVTAPQLYEENGWLQVDPFGSRPVDKLLMLGGAKEWTSNLGFPGPANPAEGEVYNTFIIPEMYAKAARGEMTPAEAVAEAEARIVTIFDKWRGEGLVSG